MSNRFICEISVPMGEAGGLLNKIKDVADLEIVSVGRNENGAAKPNGAQPATTRVFRKKRRRQSNPRVGANARLKWGILQPRGDLSKEVKAMAQGILGSRDVFTRRQLKEVLDRVRSTSRSDTNASLITYWCQKGILLPAE